MATDLHGRVILITGGSSGIGAATAIACAKAGMDVALGARRVDRLEEVAKQVRDLGRRALTVACDVNKDEDVQQLVDSTLRHYGRLDVAFANAGYGQFASILRMSDEDVRQMFETNFYGTLRLVRAAAKPMLKNGQGHLIICSSAASEISLPMFGIYAATKAAQDSVAGALRAELARKGVYVSSVHPIGTSSEFFEKAGVVQSDKQPSKPGSGGGLPNTPALMAQTPEHVAEAILRCIRKPCAEVWPSKITRYGLALTTAFPGLAAWVMRRKASGR